MEVISNSVPSGADSKGQGWAQFWDVQGAADYILRRRFTVVTLQFSDDLLREAKDVAKAVQDACASKGLQVKAFVLADTTYHSLGVDEVAAQHVHAQCVIHYGRASLSPLSSLPAYFVFTRAPLDCGRTAEQLVSWAAEEGSTAVAGRTAVIVLPDQPLMWAVSELRACLASAAHKADLDVPFIVAKVPAHELDPVPSSSPQPPTSTSQALHAGCHGSTPTAPTAYHSTDESNSSNTCSISQEARHRISAGTTGPQGQPEGTPSGGCAALGNILACCRDGQPGNSVSESTSSQNGRQVTSVHSHVPCCRVAPLTQPQTTATPAFQAASPGHWAAAGLEWNLPEGVDAQDCLWLWLGEDDAPALTQLLMTYSRMHWAMYNPQEDSLREGLPSEISRMLRKRNYLIEKAKNANIVGIVVGTLGVAGYLEAAEQIRKQAQAAGKKTYTLLMGKPSPVKLANFPEVDVFILIADAQGQILDSKEFYAPLITPYEAQLAFAPEGSVVSDDYRLDFDALLSSADGLSISEQEAAPRFSLVDGGRYVGTADSSETGASTILAERAPHALHVPEGPGRLAEVKSAADYLVTRRTYTGLETPFTGAAAKPVVIAVAGRSGRAAQYEDEPSASNVK